MPTQAFVPILKVISIIWCLKIHHITHTYEGADDMPAHIKTSLLGTSLHIPITNGKLNLGIWQGIYLCEHRNNASGRDIVITLSGA